MDDRTRLVVFDLAGTLCDKMSEGPIKAFLMTLRAGTENKFGRFRHTTLPSEQALRVDMGTSKMDHLRSITGHWSPRPTEEQLWDMYEDFRENLGQILTGPLSEPLPGVVEMLAGLKNSGIKIAATTGYDQSILNPWNHF